MRAQSATEGHDSSGREEVMGHYTPPYDVPRDANGNKEPWKIWKNGKNSILYLK